jgi:hypothetical protein
MDDIHGDRAQAGLRVNAPLTILSAERVQAYSYVLNSSGRFFERAWFDRRDR